MYNEIINAAQIVAREIETLHNRTIYLETELNKEKQRKEQLKQDLNAALASYFQEN